MSLWDKAKHFDELLQMYGDDFPLVVREYLAFFIEEIVTLFIDNEIDFPHARSIYFQLIHEIESKVNSYKQRNLPIAFKLQQAVDKLRIRYRNDPLSLITKLRFCLKKEYQRITQGNAVIIEQTHMVVNSDIEICQPLEALKLMIRESEETLGNLSSNLETNLSYQVSINPYLFQSSSIQNVNDSVVIEEPQPIQKVTVLSNLKQKYKDAIEAVQSIQTIIVEEVIKWKNEQRITGNTSLNLVHKLSIISKYCETLAEILNCYIKQIEECEKHWFQLPSTLGINDNLFPSLKKQSMELLIDLVTKTAVVEEQPLQVLKKDTKFKATVSFLVGGIVKAYSINSTVRVTIVNERQAELLTNSLVEVPNTGEIKNNTEIIKYDSNGRFSASFQKLKLGKKFRRHKQKGKAATEEKYALLFQTQIIIDEEISPINVNILSLPVVVIVAGIQEPDAWETIFWHNACVEQDGISIRVPDGVLWSQFMKMLNMKFASVTGKGLSDEQLEFLASRALRTPMPFDSNQMFLTRLQFCKDNLPELSFSFFDWFYGAMMVTKKYFREMWIGNLIIGFTDIMDARNILEECEPGTFLLMFSNTIKDGIEIAWLHEFKDGRRYVIMIDPYTPKDLSKRSLADRIADLDFLTIFYPNIPKNQVFPGNRFPEPSVRKGYVMSHLVCVVKDIPQSELESMSSSINIPSIQPSTNLMFSTAEQSNSLMFNEYQDLSDLFNYFNNI